MTKEKKKCPLKNSEKHGIVFEEHITDDRRERNAYIAKVENDENILIQEEKIFDQAGSWNKYFGNDNDIVLEIGTGLGNFFSEEVANNPQTNYLGVEVKYKRLFSTAEKSRKKIKLLQEKDTKNNFVLLKTKGENIIRFAGDFELTKTFIFFPDPWGKKDRQKKHRLFQEEFIRNLYAKTKSGGSLIFKTDHREYFDTTLELFEKIGLWNIQIKSHDYEADDINYDKKLKTEFEAIFNEKQVCYVEFKKD